MVLCMHRESFNFRAPFCYPHLKKQCQETESVSERTTGMNCGLEILTNRRKLNIQKITVKAVKQILKDRARGTSINGNRLKCNMRFRIPGKSVMFFSGNLFYAENILEQVCLVSAKHVMSPARNQ